MSTPLRMEEGARSLSPEFDRAILCIFFGAEPATKSTVSSTLFFPSLICEHLHCSSVSNNQTYHSKLQT